MNMKVEKGGENMKYRKENFHVLVGKKVFQPMLVYGQNELLTELEVIQLFTAPTIYVWSEYSYSPSRVIFRIKSTGILLIEENVFDEGVRILKVQNYEMEYSGSRGYDFYFVNLHGIVRVRNGKGILFIRNLVDKLKSKSKLEEEKIFFWCKSLIVPFISTSIMEREEDIPVLIEYEEYEKKDIKEKIPNRIVEVPVVKDENDLGLMFDYYKLLVKRINLKRDVDWNS